MSAAPATLEVHDLPAAARRQRILLVDRLRGLMVVLMVLDHVRDYFHIDALTSQPTDLSQTTPALFMTRWITHLCAPTFVFLAGVSVYLQRANSDLPSLSRFLVLRGLWLILLELTLIAFAFNFAWPFLFLQVIWVIGAGFVLLAGLVWLPRGIVLALGMAIVAGHALFALLPPPQGGWIIASRLLLAPGPLGGLPGFLAYPLLPWFGIMAVGYGLGHVFEQPPARRNRNLRLIAAGMLLAFVVLRTSPLPADPIPWVQQDSAVMTLLSFINVLKYPPSLLFALVTLGVPLLLAPWLEKLRGPLAAMLDAIGATPFFTYLLHIFLVHGLAMLVGMAMGIAPGAFVNFLGDPSRLIEAQWGITLGWVYVVWITCVLALWPVAHWYARVRRERPRWWMRYL
jgi:uncharacterized membrane protein